MKKCTICLIVLFLSGFFVLHPYDKGIFSKYCLKGSKGYEAFHKEKGGLPSETEKFWKSFKDMLTAFNNNGNFEQICECSQFWKGYQQDEFFEVGKYEKEDLERVKDIFKNAVANFWNQIVKQMSRLERVESTSEDVQRLTQKWEYANKVKKYQGIYNKLHLIPAPKKTRMVNELEKDFSTLINVVGLNTVDSQRKQAVQDYLNSWKDYYNIEIPQEEGKYDLKKDAYQKRKKQLEKIDSLVTNATIFDTNLHSNPIRDEMEEMDEKIDYCKNHHELDSFIDRFYRTELNTWRGLTTARDKILNDAGKIINLDPYLEKKVKYFREIPGHDDLKGLEDYHQTHKDSNDMIAGFIKERYRKLLRQIIEKEWEEGLTNKHALAKFQENVQKHKKDFGPTKYERWSEFLNRYYILKNQHDIPGLYCHANSLSLSEEDLNHMEKEWRIQPKNELKKKYIKFINDEARFVLAEKRDGKKRSKEDLERFNRIYSRAQSDFGFRLGKSLWSKYTMLNSYFFPEDETRVGTAAHQIANLYPELAEAYNIIEENENGITVLRIAGGEAIYKSNPVNASHRGSKKEKRPLKEIRKKEEEREIIKFLKNVKEFIASSDISKDKKKYKDILSDLLNPTDQLSWSEYKRYVSEEKIPRDFTFRMYKFLWFCIQNKQQEAFELFSEISNNDQEIGKVLYEIYKFVLE